MILGNTQVILGGSLQHGLPSLLLTCVYVAIPYLLNTCVMYVAMPYLLYNWRMFMCVAIPYCLCLCIFSCLTVFILVCVYFCGHALPTLIVHTNALALYLLFLKRI